MEEDRPIRVPNIALLLLVLSFFVAGHHAVDAYHQKGIFSGLQQVTALGLWGGVVPLVLAFAAVAFAWLLGRQGRIRLFFTLFLTASMGGALGGMVALLEYPMPWSDYDRSPGWLGAEARRLELTWRAEPEHAPWYRFRQSPGALTTLELTYAKTRPRSRNAEQYPTTVYYHGEFADGTEVGGHFEANRNGQIEMKSARIVVRRHSERFVKTLETQWVDFDRDGRDNGLLVEVYPSAAANLAGTRLSAWLDSSDGKRINTSRPMNAEFRQGEQFFSAEDLTDSRGPWQLSARFHGPQEGDFSFVLLNVASISHEEAELDSAHTRILPTFDEHPVDRDQNGLYESLELTFEVDVSFPGSYPFMADLKANGQIFASSARRFNFETSGRHSVTLSFDGKQLSRAPVDGPWTIASVQTYFDGYQKVAGTTAAVYLGDFGQTAPWRSHEFEVDYLRGMDTGSASGPDRQHTR